MTLSVKKESLWERSGTSEILSVHKLQTAYSDDSDLIFLIFYKHKNKQTGASLTYHFYQQFIPLKYWKRVELGGTRLSILSTPSSFMYQNGLDVNLLILLNESRKISEIGTVQLSDATLKEVLFVSQSRFYSFLGLKTDCFISPGQSTAAAAGNCTV